MAAKSDAASNTRVACANEDGEAVVFCNKCSEFLCETCAIGHRRHSVRPVAEISTAEVSQTQSSGATLRCEDHQQPLTIYCKTCNEFVYLTCDSLTHLVWSHDRQDVKAAAERANEQLKHMSKVITRYVANQDDVIEKTRKLEDDVSRDLTRALENVEKRPQRLCQIINDQREQLTKQLESCRSTALMAVMSIRKEATKNKTDAQIFQGDAENLSKHGSEIDQIKTTPRKHEELNELKDRKQRTMTWNFEFECRDVSEETLRKMVGGMEFTSSLDSPRETGLLLVKTIVSLHSVPLVYDGDTFASGIAVVGECLCITHHCQPDLWLYDEANGHRKVCRVPGLKDARGMALLSQDERTLVITDRNSGGAKLHFVRVDPEKLEIAEHKERDIPLAQPAAITASEVSGRLLIGQENKTEFLVCNTEGDVLKQVQVPNTDGSEVHVGCVTATRDGYAVLVRDENLKGRVKWLDEEGRCIQVYSPNDESKLQQPIQLVDAHGAEGSLIVVDHDCCILHLIDSKLRSPWCLMLSGDRNVKPDCAYLDEATSKLYVACYSPNREVLVYKWSLPRGDTEERNLRATVKLGQLSV